MTFQKRICKFSDQKYETSLYFTTADETVISLQRWGVDPVRHISFEERDSSVCALARADRERHNERDLLLTQSDETVIVDGSWLSISFFQRDPTREPSLQNPISLSLSATGRVEIRKPFQLPKKKKIKWIKEMEETNCMCCFAWCAWNHSSIPLLTSIDLYKCSLSFQISLSWPQVGNQDLRIRNHEVVGPFHCSSRIPPHYLPTRVRPLFSPFNFVSQFFSSCQ